MPIFKLTMEIYTDRPPEGNIDCLAVVLIKAPNEHFARRGALEFVWERDAFVSQFLGIEIMKEGHA